MRVGARVGSLRQPILSMWRAEMSVQRTVPVFAMSSGLVILMANGFALALSRDSVPL